jgi:hypothetical protein
MKPRPITSTLLLAFSLLAATVCTGCSLLGIGSSQSDAKQSTAPQSAGESADVKQAREDLEVAQARLQKANDTAAKVKGDLKAAQDALDKSTPQEKPKLKDKVSDLKQKADDADQKAQEVNADVARKQQRLNSLTPSSGGQTTTTSQRQNTDESDGDYLPLILKILGGIFVLLLLGCIGYGVKMFVDGSRARTEAHFSDVKKRQDEYVRRTKDALVTLNNRMGEVQSEIRELRRILQDDNRTVLDAVRRSGASSAASPASFASAYQSSGYGASAPRIEEPSFPAAAEEYLNRNRRGAVVVKTDFQNGILVRDSEENGELVLVRDLDAPDELLYAVPRIGYFQTKQDFLNYYDRYYECSRPSAGTVWIVQPAVVDKVSGGWSLREKGELEVR